MIVHLLQQLVHPKTKFLAFAIYQQSRNVIIEYLKKLNSEGTTIIYTSHHLSEAQDFCTKIAIIDRGKIYAEGTPKSLIDRTPNAHTLEDVFISLTGKELRDAV